MSTNLTVLTGGALFGPEPMGRKSLLLGGGTILAVGEFHGLKGLPGVRQEALRGRVLAPGFVDQHLHVAGAGGEGGFRFRTAPVAVADLVRAGITGVVGLLGTDGITRNAIGLLAEVRRLQAAGISSYMYSGAYWVPTRTVTESLRTDLVVVPEVLGAGEIAVSDHRGSQPDPVTLDHLAREVYVGALLAGKAGVLHLHLGDEDSGLEPVLEAWRRSSLPIRLFRPTHLNRNRRLLDAAAAFVAQGGSADITAGITPGPEDPDAVAPEEALAYLRAAGAPLDRLTLSSDANGSSPVFDAEGRLKTIAVMHPSVLLTTLRRLATRWPFGEALLPLTRTPADGLGLTRLGRLGEGAVAHVLVFSEALELERVYLAGELAYAGDEVQREGPYEERRSVADKGRSRYRGPAGRRAGHP